MAASNPKARQKERAKFYELTKVEKEAGQIQDIYRRIDMQEKYMEDLLLKYNIGSSEADASRRVDDKERSRTLEVRSDHTALLSHREGKQDKLSMMPVQLPSISSRTQAIKSSHKRLAKKRSKRKESISNLVAVPQPLEGLNQAGREDMKSVLRKAYLNKKSPINQLKQHKKSQIARIENSPSQTTRISQEIAPNRGQSGKISNHLFELDKFSKRQGLQIEELGQQSKQIPLPMGYFSRPEDSEESSEEENVPLAYYEKEYRGMIRSQCLQETNFLYFSKNESMQNWTEGLLLLFQKHDKELAGLRKRCKYLQKFDDTFFSIDIFKND